MRKLVYAIMVCSLALVACGDGRKASETVGTFLKTYLADQEYSTEILSTDSTKPLSDSIIMAMRKEAAQDKYFKKNIAWGKQPGGKLIYQRVRILQLKDTLVRTFYLDREMQNVIAFKLN